MADEPAAEGEEKPEVELRRDRELATSTRGKLYKDLIKTFEGVRQGFEGQAKRHDMILDNWDAYNCVLGVNQAYQGNAQLFVPIISNAVNARKTRFVNQIFPTSGRYIDAVSDDGSIPSAIMALLEHYVRATRLKTEIAPALVVNGDLEGQYNLYVEWSKTERHVVSRETRPTRLPMQAANDEVEVEDEPVDDIIEETITDEKPAVEVLHDTDVLVLPPSANSIEDALAQGGSVTIKRRWTKSTLEGKMDKGEVVERVARKLIDADGEFIDTEDKDAGKENIDAAGIKGAGGGKHVLVYETWKLLDVDGDRRLCRSYYGGYNLVLSCRRNPYWNDRCPLVSVPVDKISGSFKGKSPVDRVLSTQYHANDIANQAADSATYSMMPIVAVKPGQQRSSTFVINLAALWEIDPNEVKFMEFPKLWQDGIQLIQADMQLIFQTLSVTPGMMAQQTGKPGAKRNQAEIATEQLAELLSVAGACSALEEGCFTPLLCRFGEYDSQFRDDDITIMAYGDLGIEARMERIHPRQFGHRYTISWFGVEQAKDAAQKQQQIALLNVIRGFDPLIKQAGYTFNPIPVLESAIGAQFGWRMARLVLRDARSQLTVDPHLENEMMDQDFFVPVHPMDPHPIHLQVHAQDLKETGDPTGRLRVHIQSHIEMMQMQQAMMVRQGPPQGEGPQAGPGAPQPGGQVRGPRLLKQSPGAIAPESMARAGAVGMPRHM